MTRVAPPCVSSEEWRLSPTPSPSFRCPLSGIQRRGRMSIIRTLCGWADLPWANDRSRRERTPAMPPNERCGEVGESRTTREL